MADGFIVRKGGGVATEQAIAPTITQVSTTETSITFSITNNDAETAIIRHRLDDITDEGVIVELATNATSENITVTTLTEGTEFTVFATANVTGKVKSNVTQLAIFTNEIPAPTITLVSKTDTSVTFTLKNNSVETRDVTFGLTTPPTTTTISLASDATSGDQTFSNLDPDTFITLFAQAEGGLIGQLNVTTDQTAVFTAATGGTTLEYNSGGKRFRSHTFTSNGNFVVSTVGDNVDDRNKVDYLIIAGGAGGGGAYGGGGGAGGYRTTNGTSGGDTAARDKVTVTAATFGVTIGSGGAANSGSSGRGSSGTNSQVAFLTTITADGGGGGGGWGSGLGSGLTGGSGGGGSGEGGNGGPGTANEGFAGGAGVASSSFRDGGAGGGAGAVGTAGVSNTSAGNGGNGLANNLRTGSNETRAGGGGGGRIGATSGGAGGSGGGGVGGSNARNAGAGTANTGSGGGGGSWSGAGGDDQGQSGGAGIVVIRYEIAPSV